MRFENTRLSNPLSASKIGASSATRPNTVVLLLESEAPLVRRAPRGARLARSARDASVELASPRSARPRECRRSARADPRTWTRHRRARFRWSSITAPKSPSSEHLERRQHRGERRLEVVHDHLHQIVAHLLELAQLAQAVLERVGRGLELEQATHARAQHETIVRLGEKIVAAGLDRRTRSVVSLSAVTKITGMRAVRGSRLMRRQTSNPVDRSSTPQIAGGHRDIENAEIRLVLETGAHRRRSVAAVIVS